MKIKYLYLITIIFAGFMITSLLMNTLSTTASAAKAELTVANDRIPIHWFVGLGTGGDPSQLEGQQQVVADFNASQTEISLTLEIVESDISIPTLQAYIASGNSPDIVGPVGVKGSNAFKGQWLDLSSLIDSSGIDLSDIDPTLVDFFYSEDNGQVSIPFTVYPSFVFYNRDLFDQAGLAYPPHQYGQSYTDTVYGGSWNVEKQAEIAKLLTLDSADKNATDPSFDPDSIEQFGYYQQWADGRGEATLFGAGNFADANGNAQIPSHWNTAYHWFYDGMMGNQPFIPNNTYVFTDTFGDGNVFNSGRLAMAHSHAWYTCCFGEPSVTNWDIAATPEYSGSITSKLHVDSFYILKSSTHPNEAFDVLTYFLGTAAPQLLETYNGFPARTTLQANALAGFETRYPGVDWQVLVDSIPYADTPNHEGYMPNYLNAYDRIAQFYDAYHSETGLNIDDELNILQNDLQEIFHGGTQTTVDPELDSTLTYYDTAGMNTFVQIPAGAVANETTLIYTPVLSVTPPTSLLFADQAFDLNAYQEGGLVSGFTFSTPITVTLFYDDVDVTNLFEFGLGLYYWDGSAWSQEGITIISRDTANNRLTVTINHLSEFALFGEIGHEVYLPTIIR